MKTFPFILAMIAAVPAFGADAVPLFNGVLTVGTEHRFVLVSVEGKTSGWLRLGDTFEGYKLTDYDSKQSSVNLERDGKKIRANLVADAAAITAVPATEAALADAEEVLRVMKYEEGVKKSLLLWLKVHERAFFKELDDKLIVQGVDPQRLDVFHQKVIDEMLSMVGGTETLGTMAEAYKTAFSKEELKGLSQFYATPLGRVYLEKMPEIGHIFGTSVGPRLNLFRGQMEGMAVVFEMEEKGNDKNKTDTNPPPVTSSDRNGPTKH